MQLASTRRGFLAGLTASVAVAASPVRARASGADALDWGAMELLDADDRRFRIDQSSQPLTLITLWANWCGVCLRELETVNAIAPALGADKLRVLLVSHPDDWSRNQDIVRHRNISVQTARVSPGNRPSLLQKALLSADGTFYVPHSVLFSRAHGGVVWNHVGGLDWRRPEVLDHVRQFA